MAREFETYCVWRRQHCPGSTTWTLTAHTLKARSPEEASSRLARRFANCGFSAMALVALPKGMQPALGFPQQVSSSTAAAVSAPAQEERA